MKYIAVIIFALLFTACEMKTVKDGELDSNWQLMEIERTDSTHNAKADKVYWAFRNGLAQFTCSKNNDNGWIYEREFAYYVKKGDSLLLHSFCYDSENYTSKDDNTWISFDRRSDMFKYGVFGINDSERGGRIKESFAIEKLNDETLILESDSARLYFRKF